MAKRAFDFVAEKSSRLVLKEFRKAAQHGSLKELAGIERFRLGLLHRVVLLVFVIDVVIFHRAFAVLAHLGIGLIVLHPFANLVNQLFEDWHDHLNDLHDACGSG
jgi:hypothetical protein